MFLLLKTFTRRVAELGDQSHLGACTQVGLTN